MSDVCDGRKMAKVTPSSPFGARVGSRNTIPRDARVPLRIIVRGPNAKGMDPDFPAECQRRCIVHMTFLSEDGGTLKLTPQSNPPAQGAWGYRYVDTRRLSVGSRVTFFGDVTFGDDTLPFSITWYIR